MSLSHPSMKERIPISYPIKTNDGEISRLRCKRLLLLATQPKNHKRFYHQYYYLVRLGLVGWVIGSAYLTTDGQRELLELLT